MKQVFFLPFDSLRSRHLFVTAMLATFLLAGIFLAHYTVEQSKDTVTANLEQRSQMLHISRQMRESLLQTYGAMDAFLLEPDQKDYVEIMRASMANAIATVENLPGNIWISDNANDIELEKLPGYLKNLSNALEHLVKTRRDPLQQFPSLAISNSDMRPFRNGFNNAIALAITESSEHSDNDGMEVFTALIQCRHLWTQMVSNYRLYLANQLGSFDEDSLPLQEQGIQILYTGLIDSLEKLTRMDSDNRLGFETSNLLPELKRYVINWYNGFTRVREIHHSDNWRADKHIMENSIEPQLKLIWDMLLTIDKKIEEVAKSDIAFLSHIAIEQEKLLWGIAALICSMIAAGFFYAERVIFTPIARIANALRDEASGRNVDILPSASSKETRDLIDAFSNMRMQVRSRQLALEHKALHDELTSLPNRTLLFDRIEQSILAAQMSGTSAAVLIVDINNLKEINDTLGHHIGDQLLIETSIRIRKITSKSETVSRVGGNEFAILLSETTLEKSKKFADKILQQLKKQLKLEEIEVHPRFNVGIALYPQHGFNANILVQRADIAMYAAKKTRQEILVYEESEDDFSINRLALISELKKAIRDDTLEMHYQPKCDMAHKKVVGVEALLRWKHPAYGWVQPSEIIAMAEQTGIIIPLTQWTLKSAVRQCAEWKKIGLNLNVAINLSVHVLHDDNFISHVVQALTQYAVPAQNITLEITESAMMTNPMKASEILNQLNEIGVNISADDFGTGFSSLSYLKQLPVNEIKIDKSFVMDMVRDGTDEAIVLSAIGLAHNLGIKVVAEGIETRDTQDLLHSMSCDIGQGFYFSKPLNAVSFARWIKNQNELEKTT